MQEKVVAFLDGELPGPVGEVVARHLSSCRECAEEVNSFRQLNAALDLLPGLPAPTRFAKETVRKAVSCKRKEMSLSELWKGFGNAWRFAACVAVLLGLLSGGVASRSVYLGISAEQPDQTWIIYEDSEPSLSATYGQAALVDQDEQW